jgi:erythromycin esterase-like protein
MARPFLAILLLQCLLFAWTADAAPAGKPSSNRHAVMASVVRDLCSKQVALLGEASHGDGETIAFKAALIPVLVSKCHFRALLFEGSHYDFLEIMRRARAGETVSRDMVASAIGGLWNRDREMAPLIDFLTAQVAARRLLIGGIDGQLGSVGAFFSLDTMPATLAGYLDGRRGPECQSILRQRIYHDYPADAPYQEDSRTRLRACLSEIEQAISRSTTTDPHTRDERIEMAKSFERTVASDFVSGDAVIGERDRAMFANFEWLADRLPLGGKVIIWAATSHVAKSVPGSRYYSGEYRNFGSLLHDRYGANVFVLGFSAYGGAYRLTPRAASTPVPAAGVNSIEARALPGAAGEVAYLDYRTLRDAGTVEGGAFGHQRNTIDWSEALDGLVVFRTERSPERIE